MKNLFLEIYCAIASFIVKSHETVTNLSNSFQKFVVEIIDSWRVRLSNQIVIKILFLPSVVILFINFYHLFGNGSFLPLFVFLLICSITIFPHIFYDLIGEDFSFNVHLFLSPKNIGEIKPQIFHNKKKLKKLLLKRDETIQKSLKSNVKSQVLLSEFYDFLLNKGFIEESIQDKATFVRNVLLIKDFPHIIYSIHLSCKHEAAHTIIRTFFVDFLKISPAVMCSHTMANKKMLGLCHLNLSTYYKNKIDVEIEDDIKDFLKNIT